MGDLAPLKSLFHRHRLRAIRLFDQVGQNWRGNKGGQDDQDDDDRKNLVRHHAKGFAHGRKNQADLATGHHAPPDQTLFHLAGRKARGDFAHKGGDRDRQRHQKNRSVEHRFKLYAHARDHEKDRNQEKSDGLDDVLDVPLGVVGDGVVEPLFQLGAFVFEHFPEVPHDFGVLEVSEMHGIEHQARSERAHNRRQADELRQIGENKSKADRHREFHANARVDFREKPVDWMREVMARGDGADQKEDGFEGNPSDVHKAGRSAGHNLRDDRQNNKAKDVVDHSRAKHDLGLGGLQFFKVLEHARGDADRGGGEGGADEE